MLPMLRTVGKDMATSDVERMVREGGEGDLLLLQETLDLETDGGREGFLRDVAGFANSAGGHIAVGVNRSRQPVGLAEELDEPGLERLVSSFFGRRFGLQYSARSLSDGTTIGWLYVPSQRKDIVVVPPGVAAKSEASPRPGDVYVRSHGRSTRANTADFARLVAKVLAGRGYVLATPPRLYTKPLHEPVTKPPDLRRVLQAVGANRRTEFIELREKLDLDKPRDAAGVLRAVAAFSNAGGGYLALVSGRVSAEPDLASLRDLAGAHLGEALEPELTESATPEQGPIYLVWIPALDHILAVAKPFIYEEGGGSAVTALREGDVHYREGPTDVLGETRHYEAILKKIAKAKDYFIEADKRWGAF